MGNGGDREERCAIQAGLAVDVCCVNGWPDEAGRGAGVDWDLGTTNCGED